ncbi:hypothetical protein MINT15_30220 [Saccharomonospora viridis]|uniref:Uncharacterized protein n=1 Tax=Saccharomonospora viridis TaxID=1852 RepID=A0A837D5B6_9PSEU|nr:hypothetical protein MINT15_30220 [Saccharomonospora viridis]
MMRWQGSGPRSGNVHDAEPEQASSSSTLCEVRSAGAW